MSSHIRGTRNKIFPSLPMLQRMPQGESDSAFQLQSSLQKGWFWFRKGERRAAILSDQRQWLTEPIAGVKHVGFPLAFHDPEDRR
jgi:hypothetical protein